MEWWFNVDLKKFRIYLKDKYRIKIAYYFIWYYSDDHKKMYNNIEKSWFKLVFKEQKEKHISQKKWNIDSDLIFHAMKKLIIEKNDFEKIFLVSWDWDFKILVDFLIEQKKFWKILFPNKKFTSSLYYKLDNKFYDFIYNIKLHIELKWKRA